MHAQLLEQLAQLAVAVTNSGTATTEGSEEDDQDDASFAAVHHVQYLAIAAGIRLLLLVLPLMYHSYTGTAIRFYQCYRFFYGVTMGMVLLQMVALSMVDPGSLATLLPGGIPSGTPTTTTTTSSRESSSSIYNNTTMNDMEAEYSGTESSWLSKMTSAQIMETSEVSRYAWWILLLSLLSVTSHFIMLIHVRSTAPSLSYYYPLGSRSGRGKARLLYYYTSQNRGRSANTGGNRKNGHNRGNGENGDDIESQQQRVPTTLQFPDDKNGHAPTTPPPTTLNERLQKRQSKANGHDHGSDDDDDEEAGDDTATTTDFPPTSPIHKLSIHYDGAYRSKAPFLLVS